MFLAVDTHSMWKQEVRDISMSGSIFPFPPAPPAPAALLLTPGHVLSTIWRPIPRAHQCTRLLHRNVENCTHHILRCNALQWRAMHCEALLHYSAVQCSAYGGLQYSMPVADTLSEEKTKHLKNCECCPTAGLQLHSIWSGHYDCHDYSFITHSFHPLLSIFIHFHVHQ